MLAMTFALTSAIFGGAADFVGGTQSRRVTAVSLVAGSQTVGLLLMVIYLAMAGSVPSDLSFVPWALLAGIAALVGLISFYQALATGTMSVVAPIAALGVALPLGWGLLQGETPQLLQVAGIVAAIAGIVLASGPEVRGAAGLRPVILALLAAVGFGSHMAFAAEAAESEVVATIIVFKIAMAAPLLVLGLTMRSTGGLRWSAAPWVVLLALLDMGANVCFMNAATLGYVSIVSVLASLYPVVTVLLAWLMHNERLQPVQTSGVAVALAGVVLIAAGS